MKTGDLFPSNYIQAKIDLLRNGAPIKANVTIEDVQLVTFQRDGGGSDDKPVISFKETNKSLILNKTNFNALMQLYPADDTRQWVGKRITLTAKEVDYRGQPTWGTRISLVAPEQNGNEVGEDPFEEPLATAEADFPF